MCAASSLVCDDSPMKIRPCRRRAARRASAAGTARASQGSDPAASPAAPGLFESSLLIGGCDRKAAMLLHVPGIVNRGARARMRAMSRRREWAAHPLIPGALLAVFFLQMLTASALKSPTFDEPAHIGAGLSYFKTGEFKVNPQHPPLLKEVGALPLLMIGARFPVSPYEWKALGDRPQPFFQWQLGRDIIFGNDPDRVMFWSRLPFILLAVLLGAVIVAWGRRLLGATAAAGALLLYVFDPTIVAHGPLVATDSGFATFAVLFLFSLWHYLNHRSLKRLLLCGGALGLVLATKFTAVILLPVALALMLGATRWIPAIVPRRASSLVDPLASEALGQRVVWCLYSFLAIGFLAALVIEALYFFPRNPFVYLDGMRRINADHDPTYWAFMAGRLSPPFFTYYLVAHLPKETVPPVVPTAGRAGAAPPPPPPPPDGPGLPF